MIHRMAETDPSTLATSVLERVRRQDPEGWERLTRLYTRIVYAWVRKGGISEADAPDVVQDVFLEVFRSVTRFERDREKSHTFTGWVRTITRRRAIDFLRRAKDPDPTGGTDARLLLEQLAATAESASDLRVRDGSTTELVRRGLELVQSSFEDRTWNAFTATALQNRPAQDVARELGMSIGAVYVARSRVIKRLRNELDGLV
jgi:RNA polymerase sigma-70 factor (ECF subfamily)